MVQLLEYFDFWDRFFFFKKNPSYKNSVVPAGGCWASSKCYLLVNLFSKLYVTSPPKLLDRIQPNLVCSFLNMSGVCKSTLIFDPPPGVLGRGKKVK